MRKPKPEPTLEYTISGNEQTDKLEKAFDLLFEEVMKNRMPIGLNNADNPLADKQAANISLLASIND